MEQDVNFMRQIIIDAFGLKRVDEKFTFYYDETNNIRKFYLTEQGTNDPEHKNFVLGGIALADGQTLPDIAPLRAKLGMQANAAEIKFAHVAKGDFERVLGSKKLNVVLSWIVEHGILVHYSSVNIVYWAIVDIVESIVATDEFEKYQMYDRPMKNELYRLATFDKPAFLAMLRRHRYPNIQPDATSEFISDIGSFLAIHFREGDNFPAHMLVSMIQHANRLPELPFLVGNKEDVLIDGFGEFYTRPIMLF